MNIEKVIYKINQAKKDDIHHHLMVCSASFVPPLSSNVNIEAYSQKISEKADTFEAWNEERLVGLVAAYCNNFDDQEAYITNVSVTEAFRGMDIAPNLLEMCIKYVENHKLNWIRLKVNKNNEKAINLYKEYNFREIDYEDEFILMRFKVRDE